MRRLPQWHHALARRVWIWSNYTVKCHAVYHSTLPSSLCRCLGEEMARKCDNLVHKIFVCAAIFKLGHLGYGANFKLEHYRVKELSHSEQIAIVLSLVCTDPCILKHLSSMWYAHLMCKHMLFVRFLTVLSG